MTSWEGFLKLLHRNAIFNYLTPKCSEKMAYLTDSLQKMSGKVFKSHERIAIPGPTIVPCLILFSITTSPPFDVFISPNLAKLTEEEKKS